MPKIPYVLSRAEENAWRSLVELMGPALEKGIPEALALQTIWKQADDARCPVESERDYFAHFDSLMRTPPSKYRKPRHAVHWRGESKAEGEVRHWKPDAAGVLMPRPYNPRPRDFPSDQRADAEAENTPIAWHSIEPERILLAADDSEVEEDYRLGDVAGPRSGPGANSKDETAEDDPDLDTPEQGATDPEEIAQALDDPDRGSVAGEGVDRPIEPTLLTLGGVTFGGVRGRIVANSTAALVSLQALEIRCRDRALQLGRICQQCGMALPGKRSDVQRCRRCKETAKKRRSRAKATPDRGGTFPN